MDTLGEMWGRFLVAFVPLFIAIDAIGIVGLYIGLTSGMTHSVKKRLVGQATLTAFLISVVFLFAGNILFQLLGIEGHDFRVAGGVILLILAIVDLLFSQSEQRRAPQGDISIVPIGIPLIMGPAALTSILNSVDEVGWVFTLGAIMANLTIAYLVFRNADAIVKFLGAGVTKAFAKVMSVFLAAIAVMMIRKGIEGMLG